MANWLFTKSNNRDLNERLFRNAVRIRAPYPCVDTAELHVQTYDYGSQLGVAVAMQILSENVAQFKKPSDWWQAVRERFLPQWWIDKYPVKYDYINVKALYPHATFDGEDIIWKARKEAGKHEGKEN